MIGGVVEISEDGNHLSLFRGFLKVSREREEVGRVPLDDITALILSAHQITLSKALIVALADRKAIIVTCGKNWHPHSITLPFDPHNELAEILQLQIAASEPLRKRLWQRIVIAKIRNQAAILTRIGADQGKIRELEILARRVRSGDAGNIEAQAARHYWPALMGKDFRRGRNKGGVNSALNYGYTVLRAATARAVVAAGLNPALGLHHRSGRNAFQLVDDLMEPFRPAVDEIARSLSDAGEQIEELGTDHKRALVTVLQRDLLTPDGISPVQNCLRRLTASLVTSLREKKEALDIAEPIPDGRLV